MMCDWDVNLRCRHCRGHRLVRQGEHPEPEPEPEPERERETEPEPEREREVSPPPEPRPARSLCRSCQEVREELQRLNDRLAAIIERNQRLEQEVYHYPVVREESSRIPLLERQLEETREELQRQTQERDCLQLQVETLRDENRDLKERRTTVESQLRSALDDKRDLENAVRTKDGQLAACQSEKRNLENELNDIKCQLANANSTVNDIKVQLRDETLRNRNLDNQVRMLKEKLDFQKRLHEKEIEDLKKKYEDMECDNRQKYDTKIIEALEQLREEYKEKINQYREKLEKSYKTKLENCQQSAARYRDLAEASKEEAARARRKLESALLELRECRNQSSTLRNKIQDLEMALNDEKAANQQKMQDKYDEIAKLREQIQKQMEEYNNLIGVKLALDMELDAYRKMVEGEEKRLDLTPSPAPCTPRRTRGVKRRLYAEDELHEHVITVGQITFEEVDDDGKFVKVKNTSDQDQSLNGWTIASQYDNESPIIYKFPARFTIKAGQTITIWAGCVSASQRSPADLVWRGHSSWETGEDIRMTLLSHFGEEMARRTLVREVLGSRSRRSNEDCPSV